MPKGKAGSMAGITSYNGTFDRPNPVKKGGHRSKKENKKKRDDSMHIIGSHRKS